MSLMTQTCCKQLICYRPLQVLYQINNLCFIDTEIGFDLKYGCHPFTGATGNVEGRSN